MQLVFRKRIGGNNMMNAATQQMAEMLKANGIDVSKYQSLMTADKIAGEGFEIIVTAKMWQQSQAFEILGVVPYERIPESEEAEI